MKQILLCVFSLLAMGCVTTEPRGSRFFYTKNEGDGMTATAAQASAQAALEGKTQDEAVASGKDAAYDAYDRGEYTSTLDPAVASSLPWYISGPLAAMGLVKTNPGESAGLVGLALYLLRRKGRKSIGKAVTSLNPASGGYTDWREGLIHIVDAFLPGEEPETPVPPATPPPTQPSPA